MNPAMPPEQAVILLRFLFARTRSTVGQPAPVLRWLYEPADTIRGDLNRGDGVQLDGLDNDEVLPTLGDLKIILNWFLARQPVMTRGFAQRVRDMEAWLSAPAQRQKMDRIAVAFPNQLGPNGGVDHLTSFTDFISQVNTACEVISERIEAGQEWFANYEFMCLSLSKVRSLLPKV